ncbi:hypothetical protein [Streptomyces sp. NPDC056160]|uniref:hypothetical protein n=1 Tax=Streptomyces sp. NPDC056160 TaxID=3345731 RepID=UPI0035E0C70B
MAKARSSGMWAARQRSRSSVQDVGRYNSRSTRARPRVVAFQLVMNGHTVTGHLAGSPRETEEAMRFAVTNGVRPMVERMPLEQVGEAVTRLRSGGPRFRVVLDTAGVE